MTIRDYLRRRKARYLLAGVVCVVATFVLIFTGSILGQRNHSYVALAVMGGYLVCVVLSRSIRCPRCNGMVGGYTSWLNLRRSAFIRRTNYCAHCGVGFDEPVQPARTQPP